MNEESQQMQDVSIGLARRARRVALFAWFLSALAPGIAAGLAQYASLFPDDPTILDAIALSIVGIGLAAALSCWAYWGVVRSRLERADYVASSVTYRSTFMLSVGSILVFALGAFLTANGDGQSTGLSGIFAFGLGISCLVGGLLGIISIPLRSLLQERARQRARERHLREKARKEGREVRKPIFVLLALDVLGILGGFFVLLTNVVSGPWLARALHLPIWIGIGAALVAGSSLCFPACRALFLATYGEHALTPIPQVRAYAMSASLTITVAFFLIGLFITLGLGILALIPLLTISFVAARLRRHYEVPGPF